MLTIGHLARAANVTIDALRHYEREGLLIPDARMPSGYRLYGESAVRRVSLIKQAQLCGFSVSEIREFVELQSRGAACCRDARKLAVEKKIQLESKIETLTVMTRALGELISMCVDQDQPLSECPLLSTLEGRRRQPVGRSPAASHK
jgi:DNA-binding transcriptional MerR regulator